MEVIKYLQRIGFKGKPMPEAETLIELHRAHLFTVPFENLDIHLGKEIILDAEKFYEKIVLSNRGGFCYELNGLFFTLLKRLGYDAKMISARVANSKGGFGKDFDHMAIIVKLDDEWLVDVGFGDSFILPIKLEIDLPQPQYGFIYKIVKHEDEYLKLIRSQDGSEFKDQYIFTRKGRALEEYKEMCIYNQTSPQTSFTQKRICTLATEDGRITLSDLKLIITQNGVKTETMLKSEEEYLTCLKKYFNIDVKEQWL